MEENLRNAITEGEQSKAQSRNCKPSKPANDLLKREPRKSSVRKKRIRAALNDGSEITY